MAVRAAAMNAVLELRDAGPASREHDLCGRVFGHQVHLGLGKVQALPTPTRILFDQEVCEVEMCLQRRRRVRINAVQAGYCRPELRGSGLIGRCSRGRVHARARERIDPRQEPYATNRLNQTRGAWGQRSCSS